MGRSVSSRPLVLDAGAIIAIDDRDRRVAILIQRAREVESPIIIPAGALAQVWRDGARQANVAKLLKARDVQIADLTAVVARTVGELCGRRGTSDIVDASVVVVARRYGGVVATSDPNDISQLDPSLTIVPI